MSRVWFREDLETVATFWRVLRTDGSVIPNLYAGGGTAAGISGDGADGYLSGNGLLSALGLGLIAGEHAAQAIQQINSPD